MGIIRRVIAYYRKLTEFRETLGLRTFLTDNLRNILMASFISGLALLVDSVMLYFSAVPFSRISPILWLVVFLILSGSVISFGLGSKQSIRVMNLVRIVATIMIIIGLEVLMYYEMKSSGGMYVYLMATFVLAVLLNFRLREITLLIGLLDLSIALMVYFGIPPETAPQVFINQYRFCVFCTMIALPVAMRVHMHYLQRIRQYAKLERDSETDPLTGMYNRRGMEIYIGAREYKRRICAAIFDIDDFKAYNDTYGHAAGDVCLKQVAGCIKRLAEKLDSVPVRYGGEEFVVLFFTDDKEKVSQAIRDCNAEVRKLRLASGAQAIHPYITISGGLVLAAEPPGDDVEKYYALIAEADKNLYKAKIGGKNCLVE